jgi:Tol biopolymer transport system component
MSRGKAVPVLLLLLSALAAPASAQYFGQNKVQYHQFDFQVLKTDHFDIYYYPEEQAAVTIAARMAERWYTRLSTVLHHQLSTRQPIILYAAHTHFEQTNILEGLIPEGTGGVTEGVRRRMILPFAGGLAETDHVLGHEMVHAFQYDMASRRASGGREAAIGVSSLPLWFIEGMAEYLSLGPVDANTAMWIRDASSRDKMPSVDKLSDPTFFPYRYGQAFWAYVAGRWGDQAIGDLLRATGPGGDIDAAMKTVLGEDKKTFTKDWHEATHTAYAPFFETTGKPEAFGRPLVTSTTTGGDMNVAPALSPDGRRVVFLSSRSQVAIDMYVADVATGTVTKKLVETAGDPHFESLQFIDSAGDWAPDNRRFVFSGVARGQPVLSFIDVDSGHRVDERAFPSLDQIFNPAWSPDGHRIAFSGFKGGLLDLYVYDLDSKALTQLTSDAYADYDPEWSPDGKSLAWVTDRFTSNLDTLDFGSYRIGLIDVQTHQARPLAGFDTGRNTNPEFSADGKSLYFIGAPNGIPNVYRVDVADASHPVAITNVLSGVSGITPLTPALSVASAAAGLVFSVYQDNDYNLYAANEPIRTVTASDVARDAAALPPFPRRTDQIATLLTTPTEALPPRKTYPSSDYRARLSLDQVGQPAIGIGADPFGTYVGGGVSFLWSDMLGNHELGTTVYTSSRLEDTGGAVMYLNREHRWNWGFVGERTPYVTGAFGQSLVANGGQVAVVQQQQFITQTNNAATGLVQYPFSRAQRIELSAGLQHIGFTERLETQTFDPFTGQLLDRRTETHSIAQGLNLAAGTGALVYDSSVFGATSPIVGQRYRLELSQVAGSITYSGVLADYRRYFMPARPFTVAVRGLHYGRYGAGGEDPRLSPLFLGYPGLVRGYDVNSFDPGECVSDSTSGCASFDRLIGSRMIVANAELRFPLVGLFNRHELYGPVPIELALFGDAGLAWSSTDTTSLGTPLSNREWARSVGATVRVNLLGFAVGELDYVHPLDRPGRGWLWQFNLMPGF